MKKYAMRLAGVLSLALTIVLFVPQRAAADDNDPPGRVARLDYARGAVSFQPGGADEWVDARINRPMTTGDRLWADGGALAEMSTGSAYIRIGGNTGFSFLNLSDYATQIQLTEGTILVRVRRLERDEAFEIDTPNLAFSIYRAGAYKVTVNEAGDVTDVQVRQGEGDVTGGGAAYSLQEGDEGRFAGTDGLEVEMGSYRPRSDEFENWSTTRDRRIDHSYSTKYVSADVIGYEDLDENGGWRPAGEYGNVWFPHTTVANWAPYQNGHWAYIAPWGYTWVDDEPWGFAPFHYGRWVNVEGSWGWVPGPRESEGRPYVRSVYAPALVAWVGGGNFSIGVSIGGGRRESHGESVGWFPLGPREVYVPSYPVSRNYVNNVNVSNTNVTNTVVNNYYNTTVVNNTNTTNNVNVTNVKYVNQAVPGAVTATTSQAFVSAQPVARNVVQVNQREMAAAPTRYAAPTVAPSKEAVLGATVRASARPPEAVVNRTVVAKAAPPPPPVPFVQQQKAIEANGGKPLPGSEIRQMQAQEQQQVQRGRQEQPRPQQGQPGEAQKQVQMSQQQAVRIAPAAQPQKAPPVQAQTNGVNRPAGTASNHQEQNGRATNQNPQPPAQAPAQTPTQAASPQSNRPAQSVAASPNTTNNQNASQQQANRPDQTQNNNGNRPNAANNQANRPNNLPGDGNNQRPGNDSSVAARPPNGPDPALEQKHQQELEQLHKQQDQERLRVEQQQQLDRKAQDQKLADQQRQLQQQQAQKNADIQKQQQQQQRSAQVQNAAEQQRVQQQQQAQKNADQQQLQDRKAQEQRAADQQRQQLDQKHQQDLKQLEDRHAQEQQQLNQRHAQEHQQQERAQPPPQQRPQQERPQAPPPQKDKEKPKSDRPPPPQRN